MRLSLQKETHDDYHKVFTSESNDDYHFSKKTQDDYHFSKKKTGRLSEIITYCAS